ncbi:GTP cyclohydrolase-2 [Alishewanella longhuensis]
MCERVQHRVKTTAHSHRYLATKAAKMGHME